MKGGINLDIRLRKNYKIKMKLEKSSLPVLFKNLMGMNF